MNISRRAFVQYTLQAVPLMAGLSPGLPTTADGGTIPRNSTMEDNKLPAWHFVQIPLPYTYNALQPSITGGRLCIGPLSTKICKLMYPQI